jgi:Uma2 family endonuclease
MALQLEQEVKELRVKRHLFTLEEYERMCEAGVFKEDARIELIRGEIVDMAPPGPEHEDSVTFLNLFMVEQLQRRALVWPQGNTIRLPGVESRPQPDLTILRWRDDLYKGRNNRPTAKDVILLIEVSQSSVKYDRGEKLALYAEAGIPEYWIVNIRRGVIEVYTDLAGGKYQSVKVAQRGETLQLPEGLEGSILVDDVLS